MAIFKRKMTIIDSIRVTHRRKDGTIISDKIINNGWFHRFLCKLGLAHNSMTNVGFAACAGLIGDVGSITAFTYVGIGEGTDAAAATDVELGSPVKLKSASMSRVTTTATNDTLQFEATFSSADTLSGTDAITEVAAFNGNINGTSLMLLRQVYTPADSINWDQGDTYTLTVKVQCKQGA